MQRYELSAKSLNKRLCLGSEGDAGARRAQLDSSLQSRSSSTSGSDIRSASDYPLPPPLSAVGGSAEVASAARLQLDSSLQSLSSSTSGSGIQSASDYPLSPPLSAFGDSAEVASAARLQLPPGCNLNMGNVLAAHLHMIMSSNMDVTDLAASSPVLEVGGGEISVPAPTSASHGLCRHQESDLDDSGRT
jgi:hypothetical protein